MAKIIVIGNEKGGSGKTTTAMHLIVSLLKLGFKVSTIDIDSRQQSLTRYIQNRAAAINDSNKDFLIIPDHHCIEKNDGPDNSEIHQQEIDKLEGLLATNDDRDFIIIDTPGNDSPLSRCAHQKADMVITPINDSFIDLDLIGVIKHQKLDQASPGIYSAMLWEQKMKRAALKSKELQWVVVRNRLSTMDAINKRKVEAALDKLSKKFGFKIASGFGDRVIFKELFLNGLTLHDATWNRDIKMNASVIAARQELHNFVISLNLPEINEKLQSRN